MGCSSGKEAAEGVAPPHSRRALLRSAVPEKPVAAEEKPCVGLDSTVTSQSGLRGRVVRRTNTDVLLKMRDTTEQWVDICDIVVVKVTLQGTRGLREEGWVPGQSRGKPDPYCTCWLRPAGSTLDAAEAVKLAWGQDAYLLGYLAGDSLEFTVWDRDSVMQEDFLGKAALSASLLRAGSFEGELPLCEAGASTGASVLVRVELAPRPAAAPPPSASLGTDEGEMCTHEADVIVEGPLLNSACCC
mmetsp:Transcript_106430/g.343374  ORF Transcript_106430/g.343374 Transcript_106430/m.343374 type:complete len:244 (-) Transcript_106430:65-796(-)